MDGEDDRIEEETFREALNEAVKWALDALDAFNANHLDEYRTCCLRAVHQVVTAVVLLDQEKK